MQSEQIIPDDLPGVIFLYVMALKQALQRFIGENDP